MPDCVVHEPELYPVGDDEVRCLLYAGHTTEAR
jgi:hypothetical protein